MALCKQMPTQICIFEDNYYSRLLPLVYFRPVYDLKCGTFSLREKIQRWHGNVPITLHCRPYLADVLRQQNPKTRVNELPPGEYLFVNGRVIADQKFVKAISMKGNADTVFTSGGQVVAARVSRKLSARWSSGMPEAFSAGDFDGMERKEVDVTLINYSWDLVKNNGAQLQADWILLSKLFTGTKLKGKVYPGVHLINKKNIFIGAGSIVKPGVVIDAEAGSVYIGKNVTILPQSTIIGPASIGDGSMIKAGAKIYEDTTIGPMCKIGGEVEASIVHGFSNKQHDGFLGHSYLGEWVNLGAGTTNSDLKNNYGSIKVIVNGELIDSGSQFVGVTIGDHTKTAINSVLNTGTVVGAACNIFGRGIPPQFVPSFSWGASGESSTTYDLSRVLEAAKRVMSRREVILSEHDAALFRKIFALTHEERHQRGTQHA